MNEEINKMRETCWQEPNVFEQGSLSFPKLLGTEELSPDFKKLELSKAMTPTHELPKVLQVITL